MAEAVALAASIVALIDVSAKLISHTRELIEAIKAAPHELYLIHIETLTLSGILHSLQSLHDGDNIPQRSLDKLLGWNGLLSVCRRTLDALGRILDPVGDKARCAFLRDTRRHISSALKASHAKKLVQDVRRFTDLIKVALLDDLQYHVRQNTSDLGVVARATTAVQTTLEVKQLDDLLDWISPLNVSYRQSYLSARGKRFPGTGDWLLKTPEYETFVRQSQNSSLCVSGLAGSGKTVLSALVLQDLQRRFDEDRSAILQSGASAPCILYFYFDNRDVYKNTTAGFYDSLVRQLLHFHPLGYAEVLELAKKTHRVHPDPGEYQELIGDLLRAVLVTSDVFLLVDGCDKEECTDFETLVQSLRRIQSCASSRSELGSNGGTSSDQHTGRTANASGYPPSLPLDMLGRLKTFVTARNDNDIVSLWDTRIGIQDYPVIEDIRRYVHGQVYGMSLAAQAAMGADLMARAVQVIVRQSDGLFVQAKLHVETVTRLDTVDEVEQALDRLPRGSGDTYAAILRGILERYPGEKNREILRNMLVWLCQAKYCLSVSEFVAVTTLEIDPATQCINKKSIPWDPETFVLRLGPLLNVDRRTSPPEINLPHVTAEEYLEGPLIRHDPALRAFHVSPQDAQQRLAAFCLHFLGSADFRSPLTTAASAANPFRRLPGGLGVALDAAKDRWIGPMQRRLAAAPGLEYTAINWPHHLRAVADQAAGGAAAAAAWVRETAVPRLAWFLDGDDPRFRSWCEAHAYFCHELERDCRCGEWPPPEYFLARFGLAFLAPYVKRGASPGVPRLRTCPGCGPSALSTCGPREDHGGRQDDRVQLGTVGSAGECKQCLEFRLGPAEEEMEAGARSKCLRRSYKLFQTPELRWRAVRDLRRFSVDGDGVDPVQTLETTT